MGHVDSGKSTMIGNWVYNLGGINQAMLDKYEKDSTEVGKGSFKYAWIMDNSKVERERGVTINLHFKKIEATNYTRE